MNFNSNPLFFVLSGQVLLYYVFFEISGSGYLSYRHMMNFVLLVQYVPRIFRIYLSSAEFTKTSGIWVKGAFNFFLYILASHVSFTSQLYYHFMTFLFQLVKLILLISVSYKYLANIDPYMMLRYQQFNFTIIPYLYYFLFF